MLTYLIWMIPPLLLSLYASAKTKSTFKKYSKVRAASGMTGAQAAQRLLTNAGISDVKIERTPGVLSDHYNPVSKKLALSEPVFDSTSIAAIGVACHEAGHAIQHARSYKPLWLRSALVPTVGFGSKTSYFVILGGFLMNSQNLILVGAALFALVVLFQLITLPVEFDASARAKRLATEQGLVLPQESAGMSKVLNAAALTYVAAFVSSIMTLLYYLSIAFGGGRD